MPNSGKNVRLQMIVNGDVRDTAGMESLGVLTFMVDWVRRDALNAPKDLDSPIEEWIGTEVHVSLGGLDSATDENLHWFEGELRVGDEVTIRECFHLETSTRRNAGTMPEMAAAACFPPTNSQGLTAPDIRSGRRPPDRAGDPAAYMPFGRCDGLNS